MSRTAIQASQLTRRYGDLIAVNALNLRVEPGQIYGFLGPNGAGKTTTIRMLLGLIRPDSGSIYIAGDDLATHRRAALSRIGSIVETPAFYSNLTGTENLTIACQLKRIARADIDRVLDVTGLNGAGHRKVKEYSLGMRQRLGIARALLGEPDLLILDEPTNGLDPAGIREIRQLLAEAPQRFGITILVSSHLLSEVEQMASHVGVMNKGQLLFQGTLPDLMQTAPPRLEITVNDPDAAKAALNTQHADITETGLIISGVQEADIAAINRQLVETGLDVSGLVLKPPALEDIFLQLTGDNS